MLFKSEMGQFKMKNLSIKLKSFAHTYGCWDIHTCDWFACKYAVDFLFQNSMGRTDKHQQHTCFAAYFANWQLLESQHQQHTIYFEIGGLRTRMRLIHFFFHRTGDLLFENSVGRTDLPMANAKHMQKSLQVCRRACERECVCVQCITNLNVDMSKCDRWCLPFSFTAHFTIPTWFQNAFLDTCPFLCTFHHTHTDLFSFYLVPCMPKNPGSLVSCGRTGCKAQKSEEKKKNISGRPHLGVWIPCSARWWFTLITLTLTLIPCHTGRIAAPRLSGGVPGARRPNQHPQWAAE